MNEIEKSTKEIDDYRTRSDNLIERLRFLEMSSEGYVTIRMTNETRNMIVVALTIFSLSMDESKEALKHDVTEDIQNE